jgi:hypothetical protein
LHRRSPGRGTSAFHIGPFFLSRLGVDVRHADNRRFLQSQDVSKIVWEIFENLGGTGITEARCEIQPACNFEKSLANCRRLRNFGIPLICMPHDLSLLLRSDLNSWSSAFRLNSGDQSHQNRSLGDEQVDDSIVSKHRQKPDLSAELPGVGGHLE